MNFFLYLIFLYILYFEKINFLIKGLRKENWCFGLEDKIKLCVN